jgi:hypothetical protein
MRILQSQEGQPPSAWDLISRKCLRHIGADNTKSVQTTQIRSLALRRCDLIGTLEALQPIDRR